MIWYRAQVSFLAMGGLRSGDMPSPTRSFVLGDPAAGTPVRGCTLVLSEHQNIAPGYTGLAEIGVVETEQYPLPLSRDDLPIPIWYRRIVGFVDQIELY